MYVERLKKINSLQNGKIMGISFLNFAIGRLPQVPKSNSWVKSWKKKLTECDLLLPVDAFLWKDSTNVLKCCWHPLICTRRRYYFLFVCSVIMDIDKIAAGNEEQNDMANVLCCALMWLISVFLFLSAAEWASHTPK